MRQPWPIPDEWLWAEWKSVARVTSNLVDPADHQSLPHIAPNHIESWSGKLLPYRTVAEDEVISSKHLFSPGQILYSKIRPYLAKAVIVDFPGLCSADMYPVETSLEPGYLKWWMLSPEFTRLAAGEQARTVLPKINKHALGGLPVPVPPQDEQRVIVDLLEDHLSRLDAASRAIEDSLIRLKALRDSALLSVVADAQRIGQIETRSLGELARVSSGMTPLRGNKTFSDGGTIPWITSGDLHQGLITKPTQFVTQRALDETSLKIVPAGSLLVAMYGEGKTRGTAAELGLDATTNQACAAITLHEPDLRAWVRLILDANYTGLRRLAAGGVQPNLNLSLIKAIEVPVPPAETRRMLISHITRIDEARERMEEELLSAQRRGTNLRRSLLKAAFSGRLTGAESDLSAAEEMIGA